MWTKFELEEDPTTGDLTVQGRQAIDDYVTQTFREHVDADRVRLAVELLVALLNQGAGYLVQELEVAEERPRRRALSRHAA